MFGCEIEAFLLLRYLVEMVGKLVSGLTSPGALHLSSPKAYHIVIRGQLCNHPANETQMACSLLKGGRTQKPCCAFSHLGRQNLN